MGLTAQLSTDGPILDATQEDLGAGMEWEQVYQVKPRADLRCRT